MTMTPEYRTRLSPYANIFYTEWLLSPRSSSYNMSIDHILYGNLDVERLRNALRKYVADSVLLNSHIQEIDGEPYWIKNDNFSGMEYLDEAAAPSELLNYIARSFDLHQGPLYRFRLLRISDGVYRVIIVLHHIVMDGSSFDEGIIKAISNYYNDENYTSKYSCGEQIKLITNLTDILFAKLEKNRVKYKEFWHQQLQSVECIDWRFLKLTQDTEEHSTQQCCSIGEIRFNYEGAELTKLSQVKRKHVVTPYIYGLCIFAILLHRYTGQGKLAIAHAKAISEGIDFIYGAQVNTNLIPYQLNQDTTIIDLFNQSREFFSSLKHGAVNYGYYPITDIIREGDRHLLDIFFTQPDFKDLPLAFDGITKVEVQREFNIDSVELFVFELEFKDNQLKYRVRYNKKIIDGELINSFVDSYKKLFIEVLENLLSVNDIKKIAHYDILDSAQYRKLVYEFNQTEADYPRDKTVHALFEEQVLKTPNNIAVVYEDKKLTYQELNSKANQLAHYLRYNYDIKPDNLIALCLDRNEYTLIAIVGILKSGGAYVSMDPKLPDERIKYILNDTKSKLMLTNDAYKHRLQKIIQKEAQTKSTDIVAIDDKETQDKLVKHENTNQIAVVKSDNLAYVIYTSGTTGKPKGVLIEHSSVVNYITYLIDYNKLNSKSIGSQYATFDFDAVVTEIYPILLSGGSLHIVSEQDKTDPKNLNDFFHKNKITDAFLPTKFAELFFNFTNSSLINLLVAGDKLGKFSKQNYRVTNGYGPTECTVHSTSFALGRHYENIPIGKPINNVKCYVVDNSLNLSPIGAIGELVIGGVGLARGYLNLPDLTASKFISNPFQTAEEKIKNENTKIYITGDLVRMLPDGNLEYLWRTDRQIKIRGFRVEMGEIEHWINKYPGVRISVVALKVIEDIKHLVAYLVLDKNEKNGFNAIELKYFLQDNLPSYMIPAAIIVLDKIPLTSSGKIDVAALPNPSFDLSQHTKVAPTNAVESALVGIWQNVLHVKSVGVDDDFFALGGDSIVAIQVAAKARDMNLFFVPSQLFSHPTIKKLATIIKLTKNADNHVASLSNSDLNPTCIPLTPIQRWFFEQQHKELNCFNHVMLVELTFALDIAALEQALFHLYKHHDTLRINFIQKNNSWQQCYTEPDSFKKNEIIERVNISDVSTIDIANHIESKLSEASNIIDIKRAPLIRVLYFYSQDNHKNYLALIVHHLIIDGVSWRIFIEDLFECYAQIKANKNVILPPKTSSFLQWSEFLSSKYATQLLLENEQRYWLQIEGKNFNLPKDFIADSVSKELSRINVSAVLSVDETENLCAIAGTKLNTNLYEVLLANLAATICNWSEQKNLYLDVEGHGRENITDNIDVSRTVGWFTSIYPICFDFNDIESGADVLAFFPHVKHHLSLIPNKGIGYGVLRYLSNNEELKNQLAEQDKAEISFNYLGNLDSFSSSDLFNITSEPIRLLSAEENRCKYSLDIMAWIAQKKLHVKWRYSKDHYLNSTVKNLVNAYIDNIRNLLASIAGSSGCCSTTKLRPENFSLVKLSQTQLDSIVCDNRELENILPLSSTQAGIFYHSLSVAKNEVYFTQVYWQHHAGLDMDAMRQAWKKIVERHEIFRVKLIWEGLDEPLQVVLKKVNLPFSVLDWSAYSDRQQHKKLQDFLHLEQKEGIDLKSVPLLRINIIKLSANEHIIAWGQHHISFDGWSLGAVLADLYSLYNGIISHQEAQLPLKASYSDYLLWLKTCSLADAKIFWLQYLENSPSEFTDLNFEHSQSEDVSNSQYAALERELDAKLFEQAKDFAKQNHVSLNTLFQFVLALLIQRYSQKHDVVFGVSVNTRPADINGIENTAGLCINSLPFRFNMEPGINVQDCLQEVQKIMGSINLYNYTPLIEIKSWLNKNTELFNVLFIFENYILQLMEGMSDLNISDFTHYPLAFYVIPGKQIILKIVYDAEKFNQEMIANMLNHFICLLENVIKNPTAKISNIELLSNKEKQLLLHEYNNTSKIYPQLTIPELFAKQAQKLPHKIAAVFNNESLTYAELDAKSNKLANYLRAQGVSDGVLVVMYMARGINMVIGLLAILKAGGAYVPTDKIYPLARIKFILEDTGANFIVAQSEMKHELENLNCKNLHVICLDEQISVAQSHSDHALPLTINNRDLVYVIYTSGSTGNPKGVLIEHRGVVNVIYDIFQKIEASHQDAFFSLTNITFDIAVLEIFGALLFGLKLIIAERGDVVDAQQLKQQLLTSRATIVQGTPSVWQLLIAAGLGHMENLKILCGGEKLPLGLAKQLLEVSDCVWNVYGPTETTVWSTMEKIEKQKNRVDIGKPLANTTVYILDKNMQLVPQGCSGEFFIGGDGVARGYLNRPELTAKKFVHDHFTDKDDVILYATGDVVRRLPDGNIEFIDRSDNQIKISGYRVELDEIKTVLLKHQAIEDCIVVADTINDAQQLVAYFIVKKNYENFNVDELKRFLSSYLSSYMVPSLFLKVKTFQLNTSGKVNKHFLREILNNYVNAEVQQNVCSAFTEIEAQVAEIWRELLNININNKNISFFDFGGNSMMVLRMLSKIHNKFEVNLAIHDIITAPTIAGLSEVIQQRKSSKPLLQAEQSGELSSILPVVPLIKSGKREPIFLIHPVGGTIFWYAFLAKYLKTERPLYGIYDPGVELKKTLFNNLQEMAAFYLKCIKTIQKEGPYFIGGASLGATIAVEIVRQLEEAGDKVGLAILLDGWAIYPKTIKNKELLQKHLWRQYNEVKDKLREVNCEMVQPIINISLHRNKMLLDYLIPEVSSNVLLFKAKETMPVFSSFGEYVPDNFWKQYVKHLHIIEVPGSHESMLYEPNVQVLAEALSEYLLEMDS